MRAGRPAPLLLDANVLIDFWVADRSVLLVLSEGIAPLYVPLPVLREEVDPASTEDWPSLGVTAVEPSMELLARATAGRPGLSFHNRVCLLLAKENGWTCVTNDGRLRRECQREHVAIRWGLELLVDAVQQHVLAGPAAAQIGRLLREASPGHLTEEILERFLEQIGQGPLGARPRKRRR